jgi:hypothetical protein
VWYVSEGRHLLAAEGVGLAEDDESAAGPGEGHVDPPPVGEEAHLYGHYIIWYNTIVIYHNDIGRVKATLTRRQSKRKPTCMGIIKYDTI